MYKIKFKNQILVFNTKPEVEQYLDTTFKFLGGYIIENNNIFISDNCGGVGFIVGSIDLTENVGKLCIIDGNTNYSQDLVHHHDLVINSKTNSLVKNRYGTTNLIIPNLNKNNLNTVNVYIITDELINNSLVDLSVIEHIKLVFRCTKFGITVLKDVDNIFDGTEFCSSYYNNILKTCRG